jgi:hypothetical protein
MIEMRNDRDAGFGIWDFDLVPVITNLASRSS